MRFEVWYSNHRTPDGKPDPAMADKAWSVKVEGSTDIQQCAGITVDGGASVWTRYRTSNAPYGYLVVSCRQHNVYGDEHEFYGAPE